MPTPSYQVTCTRNEQIAAQVYEIAFTKPADFDFVPGQFVLWDVPLLSDPTDIQTRAYSIASSPLEEELLFVVKLKEGGRASEWIEQQLTVGDEVRIQGPFGVFKLDRATDKDWLLVCTSTGIAPFRSQLVTFLKEETRRIDLIFGARREEDLFWIDFFQQMSTEYESFFIHFALSKPSAEWKGHIGRVQTLCPQLCKDPSCKKIYVCGNPDMTKDLKKICLEELGIEKQDFHMEGYI